MANEALKRAGQSTSQAYQLLSEAQIAINAAAYNRHDAHEDAL
jgi:hypothetical protein